MNLTHPSIVCCVCGGFHHSDDCELARRFIAECRGLVYTDRFAEARAIREASNVVEFDRRRAARQAEREQWENERAARITAGITQRNRAMRARRASVGA